MTRREADAADRMHDPIDRRTQPLTPAGRPGRPDPDLTTPEV
jgi:hypothetical protein